MNRPPFGLSQEHAAIIQSSMQAAGWNDRQIEAAVARFARQMQEGVTGTLIYTDRDGSVEYTYLEGGILIRTTNTITKGGTENDE